MLSEPEFASAVAQAYVDGYSRQELADQFNVTPTTISIWVKDPRVTSRAAKLTQERVLRITRKIDQEIENRLEEVDEMDPELLLKIRKEFLSKSMVVQTPETNTAKATTDLQGVMEEDPEFAKKIAALAAGGKSDG